MTTQAMPPIAFESEVRTMEIIKEQNIEAPIAVVFETLLEQIGPENEAGQDNKMPMKLEAWPGGRWYRDLGNSTGHFWGHVQVIKPPTLLEISGPMFMSYPAVSHIQYRLTAKGNATQLLFTHRAMGLIQTDHSEGVKQGWNFILNRIREAAQKRAGK